MTSRTPKSVSTGRRPPWRQIPVALCAFVASCAVAVPALAQTPAAPAGATPTMSSRPLYFEVMIVVVMAGVSLYAVCRSSRRN
jgi:hypothetical protein